VKNHLKQQIAEFALQFVQVRAGKALSLQKSAFDPMDTHVVDRGVLPLLQVIY
jgi:hypothetical protein